MTGSSFEFLGLQATWNVNVYVDHHMKNGSMGYRHMRVKPMTLRAEKRNKKL